MKQNMVLLKTKTNTKYILNVTYEYYINGFSRKERRYGSGNAVGEREVEQYPIPSLE